MGYSPMAIGLSVLSSGGNYSIDVTCDDVSGTFKNPALPSSAPYTTFSSTTCNGGGIAPGTGNALGAILQPISAIRLTSTSTTAGGAITLSIVEMGVG